MIINELENIKQIDMADEIIKQRVVEKDRWSPRRMLCGNCMHQNTNRKQTSYHERFKK